MHVPQAAAQQDSSWNQNQLLLPTSSQVLSEPEPRNNNAYLTQELHLSAGARALARGRYPVQNPVPSALVRGRTRLMSVEPGPNRLTDPQQRNGAQNRSRDTGGSGSVLVLVGPSWSVTDPGRARGSTTGTEEEQRVRRERRRRRRHEPIGSGRSPGDLSSNQNQPVQVMPGSDFLPFLIFKELISYQNQI